MNYMIKLNVKKLIMLILLVVFLCLGLCSCSFPQPKPEEGVWYCDELMIEIDFFVYNQQQTQHCAKKYNQDGTYQDVLCCFDYGSVINICSVNQEENYLIAEFLYRNGTFSVTTMEDNRTYIFERIDD